MSFHERPLVAFAALTAGGAGILAAHPIVTFFAGRPPAGGGVDVAAAMVFLAAGFVISTAHLGRKARAPLALWRVGRSRLSTEVASGSVLLAAGTLLALVTGAGLRVPGLDWLTVVAAWAFLLALGLVYRLPGQVAWGPESVPGPLAAGLVFGAAWHGLTLPPEPLLGVIAGLAAVDGGLLILRWRRLERAVVDGDAAYPACFVHRRALLAARLLAMTALVPGFWALGVPLAAVLSAAAGLVLDRLAFYALAVRETVEGRIGRVEAAIAGNR